MNTILKWRTHGAGWLAAVIYLYASFAPAFAQLGPITHFVAPQYPPLARRTAISGQVLLKLTVDAAGKVSKTSVESSANSLLTESATAAVKQWEFSSERSKRFVTVRIIYGLSGVTRDVDPITTVMADFGDLAVRVYVTTDSYRMSHPAAGSHRQ